MPQRSIRFPDDLAEAIEHRAAGNDRSFSWLVINACRAAYLPQIGTSTGRTMTAASDAGSPLPKIAPRRTP